VPTAVTLHSLTKDYAVPGLRIGYVTAPAPVVERLRRYMRPWSVNALAIEAALFLLEHDELLMRPDLYEAQRLNRRLNGLRGITALPTDTNFMLCHLDNGEARQLKQWLMENHGILIRDASNFHGLDRSYFRVAAQSASEDDELVSAISEYLSGKSRHFTKFW
jgi:threonine-phosphate decarboxylase